MHRAEADEVTWDVYETTARRGVQQAARDRRRERRGTRQRAARGAREQRLKPCEVRRARHVWLCDGGVRSVSEVSGRGLCRCGDREPGCKKSGFV